MNEIQRWVENTVGYTVAWDETAAWVQAVGAIVAILAAIAVASHQTRMERRRSRAADAAYVAAAVTVLEHAEVAMSEVQRDLGGMKSVDRDQVAISPSLHMLEAVEGAFASLGMNGAPSMEVARALMTGRFHVRKVAGGIRAFLADAENKTMRMDYDEDELEVAKAAKAARGRLKPVK